jgi:hypothetical protein
MNIPHSVEHSSIFLEYHSSYSLEADYWSILMHDVTVTFHNEKKIVHIGSF